jgi:DNA-binding beta-propeller fold protein YncE
METEMKRMKRYSHEFTVISCIVIVSIIMVSCNSPVEPNSEPNPDGNVVAWFNGLANTVDLYFPESDLLVSTAYITGNAPNDMLYLGSDKLAVLSSLSSILQVFDLSVSGSLLHEVAFPGGSNPWAMAYDNENIWVTLLLTDQIISVSTEIWTLGETIDVSDYPYGIAVARGSIFVSHGDFPGYTTPGGVTVIDALTLEETGWIDTGQNTIELWYCSETGNIHAFSYTYTDADDGVVSIIDPVTATIKAQVHTGGTPHSPVRLSNSFACCDWGSSVFFYDESGSLLSTWIPDSSIKLAGLAVSGDTIYMTDFDADMVYIADWTSKVMLDSLSAGNGPQGIITVNR